jgi:hypothetical protein
VRVAAFGEPSGFDDVAHHDPPLDSGFAPGELPGVSS